MNGKHKKKTIDDSEALKVLQTLTMLRGKASLREIVF